MEKEKLLVLAAKLEKAISLIEEVAREHGAVSDELLDGKQIIEKAQDCLVEEIGSHTLTEFMARPRVKE